MSAHVVTRRGLRVHIDTPLGALISRCRALGLADVDEDRLNVDRDYYEATQDRCRAGRHQPAAEARAPVPEEIRQAHTAAIRRLKRLLETQPLLSELFPMFVGMLFVSIPVTLLMLASGASWWRWVFQVVFGGASGTLALVGWRARRKWKARQ